MVTNTPKPPYYAVIFTTETSNNLEGYEDMEKSMSELVSTQDGFLGEDSSPGITISYWKDLESIRKWKMDPEHLKAQQKGKEMWYTKFITRIVKVEREYSS